MSAGLESRVDAPELAIRPEQYLPSFAVMTLATRLVALPIFRRADPASYEGEVLRRFCPNLDAVKARAPVDLADFLFERFKLAKSHARTLPRQVRAQLKAKIGALGNAIDTLGDDARPLLTGHKRDSVETSRIYAEAATAEVCMRIVRDIHDHVVSALGAALLNWGRSALDSPDIEPNHAWVPDWVTGPKLVGPTSNWGAGASTLFLDDLRNGRLAQIRLELAIEAFDWPSFLVLAWLFSHEYVCHVQQQTAEKKPRQSCRQDCVFYEGWMDQVAYMLFEADLVCGWLGKVRARFIENHRDEVVQAAADFRRDRYATGPASSPTAMQSQWAFGAEAARSVRSFLETTSPQKDDDDARRRTGLAQLVALSFRIQNATADVTQLDQIVCGCLQAVSIGSHSQDTSVKARVLQLLTRPISSASQWIQDLKMCGAMQ